MNTTKHQSGRDQIADFCRSERRTGLLILVTGGLSLVAGALSFWFRTQPLLSTGVPFILIGIVYIWLGNTLVKRAVRGLSELKTITDLETYLHTYVPRSIRFIDQINQSRNVSAFVLAISIVGILGACLIDWFTYSVWTWIVLTAGSALMSVIAYYHVFRLEIHLHEVTREEREEEQKDHG